MIRIQDARFHKGAEVIYYPSHVPKEPEYGERGVIQDANDHYVFVLYLGDRVAKATNAADLVFARPGMQESYESTTRSYVEVTTDGSDTEWRIFP